MCSIDIDNGNQTSSESAHGRSQVARRYCVSRRVVTAKRFDLTFRRHGIDSTALAEDGP